MKNFTLDANNGDDVIDLRDIIERFEGLESEIEEVEGADDFDALKAKQDNAEVYDEHATLEAFLESLKGCGGDEQWRGDWYPVTLIRAEHFEDYAQQLAEDIGAIDRNASWPNQFIDWKAAADALADDYSTCDLGENTYFYR